MYSRSAAIVRSLRGSYCARRFYFRRWQETEKQKAADEKERAMMKQVIDPKTGATITYEDWMRYDVTGQKPYRLRTLRDSNHPGFDYKVKWIRKRYIDYSPTHLRQAKNYSQLQYLQYDQRFIPERLLILGPDLGAAHFLTHRGIPVKFAHMDEWIDDTGRDTLPGMYDPTWKLEAIDASDSMLLWEGFDNIVNLKNLRLLHLCRAPFVDDWCLDRLSEYKHTLEFLDLSHCTRISARGLTALASLKKLKYLRLDGLDHIPGLAYAALRLEESVPGLSVVGVDFDVALKEIEKENKLLEQPGVFEDGRGNIHMQDEQGDWYYLKGMRHEKPITDEYNLPLYISRIRRDPPDVSPDDAERINRLCDGKLKHMLVGSPSGQWTVETERILSFEAYYMLKDGKEIDPIMLPESMKEEAPTLSLSDQARRLLPSITPEFESNLPPKVITAARQAAEQESDLLPDPQSSLPVPRGEKGSAVELRMEKSLLKDPDAPISFEIKSQPPKPRRKRVFSKYQRYSGLNISTG